MKVSSIHTKELTLLESMSAGADKATRQYLRVMHENFVVPYNNYLNGISHRIDEAELTPDQITKLFGTVAQGAQAAGGNETMLGKLLPDSIKQKFADSLPPADAGEVPGFEQKAAQAVQQVQDPAAKQSLMQLIKTGLQNPTTQKLIIAGVQGVAGVAAGALTGGLGGKLGATAAGAITGGLVGMVAAKLQGQDWKSAAKAGLKGAAVGGAGGLAGSLASGAASTALDAVSGNQGPAADAGQHRGAASGDMAPGDFDKMSQTPTNPDGTPMTVDQINAAKADQAAGNTSDQSDFVLPVDSQIANNQVKASWADEWRNADAATRKEIEDTTGMTADQLKNFNTGSGAGSSEFAAQDPRRVDQPIGAGAGRGSVNPDTVTPAARSAPQASAEPAASGIEPRGGWGAQEKINQMVQQKVDAEYAAKQQAADAEPAPSGIKPRLPPGSSMSDFSNTQQAADAGPTAGGVPIGSTEPGINRLTGKPISSGPTWDQMTPDQQQRVLDRQAQERADAEAYKSGESYADRLNRLASQGVKVRGLQRQSKEYTAKPINEYVDRDTTIFMWALNESQGKPRGGVHLTEAGVSDLVGKIGSWLKTKAQNLTQKVTPETLMQAWTKAGKPTDSDKIAELLTQQGIDPSVVSSAYQSMGIPATATKPAAPAAQPTPAPTTPAAPATSANAAPAASTTGTSGTTPPAAPATSANAAPTTGSTSTSATSAPAPAAQASAPTGGGSGIFADPKKLAADFQSYLDAGGSIPPQMRGILKDILLTALRTVESKQRKLNKIVKESKRIEKSIIELKKKKHL